MNIPLKKLYMKFYDSFYKKINYIQYLKKKGTKIGENCEIYGSANFGSEPYLIELGNHVRINAGVQLITHDGGVWVLRENEKIKQSELIDLFGKITIGNNVHIGTNAIIMPNVTIGDNCIIGCGSIVTKSIPANSVVVGVPGKVIESINEYYNKNYYKFDYTKKLSPEEKKKYLLTKFYD
ncbi:acyltransferase [Enterococcus cecorum]|uniref:Acyltransferase n=1 Tax=Enterococcus cecorum DSM 20682 = ATCC 43198 TaxID=1121864 RepID=S1RM06_9ENTE|nr:acyltransferase [Enterococcus cecorum]EOX17527.1 hypothetical protein I567_01471 [Enterococcus cecorum DSM 20682 = ATCC 43198]ESK60696.1 hypothetical protein OMO_02359 [Enterococcus cecorum DSM 20682 = ATCC 43198]OJG32334.1 hypothetical protein RT42_GL000468 [Enterococcus cecorum DSM 20682 = ATCC 43198]CAI3397929.1 acyltransferase [Enterococcus cecorum DSM 20682 = ATCC 43198]SQE54290.1 maltose O-acetyltransferase [Enterococcus cecorum]